MPTNKDQTIDLEERLENLESRVCSLEEYMISELRLKIIECRAKSAMFVSPAVGENDNGSKPKKGIIERLRDEWGL